MKFRWTEWGARQAGWLVFQFAAALRRLLAPRPVARDDAPPVVAVLCESFVRYGVAQAVGFRRAGAEVVLYYVDRLSEFDDDRDERGRVLQQASRSGVAVVELPRRDLKRIWQQTRWLHTDLTRRNADVIIAHAHIDPRYATLGVRFPVMAFVHDPRPHTGDFESRFPWPVRLMSRLSEGMAVRLLLHSERLVPELIPFLRAVPVTVVPHGASTRARPVPVPSSPLLVLAGRLMEYKGIDTALEAFRMVRLSRPDVALTLAGRGRMGPSIREAGIEGVELIDGYIPEADMDELLDAARLVLLPYRDATQSGVGLQAIGRGIPCVVSDAGALPDLVPPGMNGLVFPRGDSTALAAAIVRWIDHTNSDRADVLSYAHERFEWVAVASRLLRELGYDSCVRADPGV